MPEENVEIVRSGFAAFERGDMEALLRLIDEDIVITQVSDVPGIPAQQDLMGRLSNPPKGIEG